MKARTVGDLDPAAPLRPNAARIVRVRLDAMRSFAAAALQPPPSPAPHRTPGARPPARRGGGGPARGGAKDLQGVLGEIHDCDVMLPRAAGIESLEALLKARRELLFRRFRELWRAHAEKGTWEALERALSRRRA